MGSAIRKCENRGKHPKKMKPTLLLGAMQNGAKRIPMGLVLAVAVTFLQHGAQAVAIDLGTAANFAILAGTKITDGPPLFSSTITGDVGLSPTTGAAITGLTAAQVTGTIYTVDGLGASGGLNNPGLLTIAKNDLTDAYVAAAGATPTGTILANQFGGLNLGPGVYNLAIPTNPGDLTGTLTLSGSGLFVFQLGADLQTAIASSVVFENGANACDVIWQVGSSANLLGADFDGTILALTSITLGAGVTVHGRLLARNGEVTLIGDTIIQDDDCQPGGGPGPNSVPDTGSTLLLLGSVMATLLPFRRQFFSLA